MDSDETDSSNPSDLKKNGTAPDIYISVQNGRHDHNTASEEGDTEDNHEHGNRHRTLPIDRGWAWVVLVACFLECAIIVGYFKCLGVFFVQLQRRFQTSSAGTSLIFSLQNASFSITALLVMSLGHSISSRTYVVLSAWVVAGTFFTVGFLRSMDIVYLVGGVVSGSFIGCMQPNVVSIMNMYFEKYRGLANNIANGGVSVGALSLVTVYTFAFEHYGFTNTYIIAAAITLQVAVLGMLLRPMGYYQARKEKSMTGAGRTEQEVLLTDDEKLEGLIKENSNGTSENNGTMAIINGNKTDIAIMNKSDSMSVTSSNPCSKVLSQIKQKLLTNCVLKKPVFLYYLLCNVFVCAGCVIVEGFIAPHAVDVGISNERVAILISSIAIADLCSKLFFGYISDRKWIRRSTILALASLVLGVCCFFMFFLNTFGSVLAYSIIAGSLQPVYFALYPVIAVDILSLDELKSALGFIALTQGVSNALCFPFAGFLRDTTGRYYVSFCFAGTMLVIGGILCFFLPNVTVYCNKKSGRCETEPSQEVKEDGE